MIVHGVISGYGVQSAIHRFTKLREYAETLIWQGHMMTANLVSAAQPGAPRKLVPFSERPTCSIAEACQAAGFGRTKLYELMDEGQVQTVKIGRRRLVCVPSLLALLSRIDDPLTCDS